MSTGTDTTRKPAFEAFEDDDGELIRVSVETHRFASFIIDLTEATDWTDLFGQPVSAA